MYSTLKITLLIYFYVDNNKVIFTNIYMLYGVGTTHIQAMKLVLSHLPECGQFPQYYSSIYLEELWKIMHIRVNGLHAQNKNKEC